MDVVVTHIQERNSSVLNYWFAKKQLSISRRFSKSRKLEWESSRIALKQALLLSNSKLQDPKKIDISAHASGEPFVSNATRLKVSMAHTERFAIGAVSEDYIGVDIEQIRPRSEYLDHLVAGKDEFVLMKNISRNERVYYAWLLKEAVLKAMGTGLMMPMRKVKIIRRKNDRWLMRTDLHQITHWQGIIFSVSKKVLAAAVVPAYVHEIPSFNWYQPPEL